MSGSMAEAWEAKTAELSPRHVLGHLDILQGSFPCCPGLRALHQPEAAPHSQANGAGWAGRQRWALIQPTPQPSTASLPGVALASAEGLRYPSPGTQKPPLSLGTCVLHRAETGEQGALECGCSQSR